MSEGSKTKRPLEEKSANDIADPALKRLKVEEETSISDATPKDTKEQHQKQEEKQDNTKTKDTSIMGIVPQKENEKERTISDPAMVARLLPAVLQDDLEEEEGEVLKDTSVEPATAAVSSKVKQEHELSNAGDEYELETDTKGETKIEKLGVLKEGRQYRIATFTLLERGDKLFMLATKVARIVGVRDSHSLFLKYHNLRKISLSNKEKFDLIERKLLPISYKGRTINVITARSVFMEFGAITILNGKKVIDDYYEQRAIDKGATPGDPAYFENRNATGNPINILSNSALLFNTSILNQANNAASSAGGASGANIINGNNVPGAIDPSQKFQIRSNITKTIINEENWMLTHCLASKQLDFDCSYDRLRFWNLKFVQRDPYTGVKFYPLGTQPSVANWKKVKLVDNNNNQVKPKYIKNEPLSGKITYETFIHCPNLARTTGLVNVSNDIFDDVVSPEVKAAILQQKQLEQDALNDH